MKSKCNFPVLMVFLVAFSSFATCHNTPAAGHKNSNSITVTDNSGKPGNRDSIISPVGLKFNLQATGFKGDPTLNAAFDSLMAKNV